MTEFGGGRRGEHSGAKEWWFINDWAFYQRLTAGISFLNKGANTIYNVHSPLLSRSFQTHDNWMQRKTKVARGWGQKAVRSPPRPSTPHISRLLFVRWKIEAVNSTNKILLTYTFVAWAAKAETSSEHSRPWRPWPLLWCSRFLCFSEPSLVSFKSFYDVILLSIKV